MNIIRKKLRSVKGASITFALLLFLVCAVISSVVLVAGTTSAGRLSGMAESEQKYYSVTSTAKVIQELMESEQITIIEYDDEQYFVTGSQLVEISSKTPKSLPEYAAAQICDSSAGNTSFSISSNDPDLNSALSGVSISGSSDGYNDVLFTVQDKGYSFTMRFTTNKESAPIDIDSGTASGTRTVYGWTLADMGSY